MKANLLARVHYEREPRGLHRITLKPMAARKGREPFLVLCHDFARLAAEFKNDKMRAGYGRECRKTSFTRHARTTVHNACHVMEVKYGKEVCLFFTGTLPGSTMEACRTFASHTGRVTHNLYQWLYRNCPTSVGLHVWEWQDRGALHIHWCVACPDKHEYFFFKNQARKVWIRQLMLVSKLSHVDLFERAQGGTWKESLRQVRARTEQVEKSVAGYMGHYLSKEGCKKAPAMPFYPSRWWGMNDSLRQLIEDQTVRARSGLVSLPEAECLWTDLAQEVTARTDDARPYFSPFDHNYRGLTTLQFQDDDEATKTLAELLAPAVIPHSNVPLVIKRRNDDARTSKRYRPGKNRAVRLLIWEADRD